MGAAKIVVTEIAKRRMSRKNMIMNRVGVNRHHCIRPIYGNGKVGERWRSCPSESYCSNENGIL